MSVQEERFTAIANAIREKDSTTAPISANDFATRILAIKAGSDFAVPLVVSTSAGALITAVNGNITVTGTADADGNATLILTAPGFWAVTASLDSDEKTDNVEVSNGYNVELNLGWKPRLPEGYTEVEYVQSNNICRISTNYTVSLTNGRIVMDIEPSEFSAPSGVEYIFGIYNYNAASKCNLYRTNTSIQSIFGTESKNYGLNMLNKRMIIDCNFIKNTILFGNESYSISKNGTTATPNFCIFRPNSVNVNSIVAKLYSMQIYNGNTLVRDFVPCINPSGVVGLYDLANNAFYKTDVGTLTAGPALG